jgi:class 3 adenylate cyclase
MADVINFSVPYEANLEILVVIAKMTRLVRLIRSATVVEIASRLNFYWYYEHLNPCWYWSRHKESKERQRRLAEEDEENLRHGRRAGLLPRRDKWGELELATSAAVKAHKLDHGIHHYNNNNNHKSGPGKKLKGGWKRTGRFLGLLPEKNLELKRNIAATKIQRAWKNRQRRPTNAPSEDGGFSAEDELAGLGGYGSSRGRNALERALKKRSMMGLFQQQQSKKSSHASTNNISTRSSARMDNTAAKKNSAAAAEEENRPESQVGNAMGELTGQRVALGILVSMLLTTVFSYREDDATKPATMVVLHGQTIGHLKDEYYTIERQLNVARKSVISELYLYEGYTREEMGDSMNNQTHMELATLGRLVSLVDLEPSLSVEFDVTDHVQDVNSLRDREKLEITVLDERGMTVGTFVYRHEREAQAWVVLVSTIFGVLVWFLGVTAFAGPVMTLVIIPIERMVRLLGMLMLDPLGYQSTSRFKKFLLEEDKLVKNSQWTKDVLKGMETSFLMSTILRIGSLMKVGFGSAGVEIIRNNLQSGQNNNMLILNSQGSMVACIFLFCDIRQFTDATECLQEEVFVFTNRIAAVVHSICNAYGGSANKNVGDAFLMSWLLEDDSASSGARFSSRSSSALQAKNNQADKALLSVVRICIALQYNDYYVSTMSDTARNALLTKIKNRPGPVVQMGFGLHAGKAVQGAIGSQRKIDATYVSEAVERAEFLESSTKQYGVKMLMSDAFHRLLHPGNRRRCRKVDQIIFQSEEEAEEQDAFASGDIMELFTYDMDVDGLWGNVTPSPDGGDNNSDSESERAAGKKDSYGRPIPVNPRGSANLLKKTRRLSKRRFDDAKGGPYSPDELKSAMAAAEAADAAAGSTHFAQDKADDGAQAATSKMSGPGELILPTRTVMYSANIWLEEDMRRIRHQYTHVIFRKFNSGLQAFYQKDWVTAKQCFGAVLERFPDGPSKYFMKQIEKHNGVPPRDFMSYGKA